MTDPQRDTPNQDPNPTLCSRCLAPLRACENGICEQCWNHFKAHTLIPLLRAARPAEEPNQAARPAAHRSESPSVAYWVGLLLMRYRGWTIERGGPNGMFLSKGDDIEFVRLGADEGRGRRALYDLARKILDRWEAD